MPVVINEFEVVPEPPKKDGQATVKKDEKSVANQLPTDHELKKILERRMERLERISAH